MTKGVDPLDVQRTVLFNAALEFAKNITDLSIQKRLLMAADEYAKARWNTYQKSSPASSNKPPASNSHRNQQRNDGEPRVPYGRCAGKKLSEILLNELIWMRDDLEKKIDDPECIRYRDRNEQMLKFVYAEFGNRKVQPP